MHAPLLVKCPQMDSESFEKGDVSVSTSLSLDELRIHHENAAGRLVIDPRKARAEFGDDVMRALKLSPDGTQVLWPQPFDDPRDPQNWSDFQKNVQLTILTLAAFTSEFYVGIGIAGVASVAETFNVSRERVTTLATSWAVFMLGWGGLLSVIAVQRFGRLPVLFWTQVLALGFLIGCACAPSIEVYACMRCLCAFFSTAPHIIGLYIINDIFPFHLQARKLGVWVLGFIISPFFPPFALGFLAPRAGFRWPFGVGIIYGGVVVVLTALFSRETFLDRSDPNAPDQVPENTVSYRVKALLGIRRPRAYRPLSSWTTLALRQLQLVWRPHLLGAILYEGFLFGFGLGMNLTSSLFLGEPAPLGYGFDQDTISTIYLTPVVAVILGQIFGRHLNDFITARAIRRNNGVFEAESRLWSCAVALPVYVLGLVISGVAFQKKLPVGAVVMGWAIREVAIMTTTVAVYAYVNDCFPRYPGEVSGLVNLCRTLCGFAVPYFQTTWARKNGALQVFGCEAAIVSGLFFLCIATVYRFGPRLREKYSM